MGLRSLREELIGPGPSKWKDEIDDDHMTISGAVRRCVFSEVIERRIRSDAKKSRDERRL